jgi:hypothetical protein
MVPYASFPYADHVLRLLEAEPNTKAEPSDDHIELLTQGASKLKQIMQDMERMSEIKGFIVYQDDPKKVDTESKETPEKPDEDSEL